MQGHQFAPRARAAKVRTPGSAAGSKPSTIDQSRRHRLGLVAFALGLARCLRHALALGRLTQPAPTAPLSPVVEHRRHCVVWAG
jgi:hypothetical protein